VKRSLIVETISRWVVPFIFLYGLYIVVYGHLSPGGGFAGGVILSCAFVLVMLAQGKTKALCRFPFDIAKGFDTAGALLFLVLAILGIVGAGVFFVNFIQKSTPGESLRLFNGGIIPLCNIAISMKVCASLFLVALALSALRVFAGGSEENLKAEEEE
jgi:multisubunit Na+/H+ antiporter MnhB subunit